tara:strand:+ start:574 stop:765 length:192 start_codon:yes stop_codon:yes gene_type:complete
MAIDYMLSQRLLIPFGFIAFNPDITNCTTELLFSFGLRAISSDAEATNTQKIGLLRISAISID